MANVPIFELFSNASGLMVLLAAGVMVFRTFREPYLLSWLGGWSAYLIYRLAGPHGGEYWAAASLAQAAFVLGVTLFALAILQYVRDLRWMWVSVTLGFAGIVVAITQPRFWPESFPAVASLHAIYLAINLISVVQLIRHARARREPGLWLMGPMLLLLHIDAPGDAHLLGLLDVTAEMMLGASMLLVVVGEAHRRTTRLATINSIATSGASATDSTPAVNRALWELASLYQASTAWFVEYIEGDYRFVRAHGVAPELAAAYCDTDFARRVHANAAAAAHPIVAASSSAMSAASLDHTVVVPVIGTTSTVGLLELGFAERREYRSDELEFLMAAGKQLGIAVESVRMFQRVADSQRRWVATFDAIDDAVLVHDSAFRLVRVNRALAERIGRPAADLSGATFESIFIPDGWAGCPYCSSCKQDASDAPDPCFGGHSMVSTSTYSEGGVPLTLHVVRDTTERHRAEERYRVLFERIAEGVFVTTAEGTILDCNDAFSRIVGYSREELQGVDIGTDVYEDPQERANQVRELSQSSYLRDREYWIRRKDGSRACVVENSFMHRHSDGTLLYQGFLQDVTEKKRAEEEVKRRNRELHALNAIATAATQTFDPDQLFHAAIDEINRLFRSERGSIYLLERGTNTFIRKAQFGHSDVEASDRFTLPQDFLDRIEQSRTELITQQHLPHLPAEAARFVGQAGLRSWLWSVMWAGDTIIGAIGVGSRDAHDFTPQDEELLATIARQLATSIEKIRLYDETRRAYDDLRRTQEQLLQSEKMSAVGQLISGVAHELNNPLTAILGYTQLLEAESLPERCSDYVSKLYKQTQRTHRVVQNLLSFARQRKPQKQQVDVRRVLDDTIALRDYDLKLNNVQVVRDFASSLPVVVADPHQLEQVYLNILNNASDAVLECSRRGTVKVRAFAEGNRVVVEFRDSGPGIRDPKRIFDPFYTTKAVGKGTGLGLSICYGIVKEHGGEILASNHPDGGAVFRVELPATGTFRHAVNVPQDSENAVLCGRVLVVDDEAVLLEFEREVLTAAGADVTCVASGDLAVRLLQNHDFDAVISDFKMPGEIGGAELYRWIARNRPTLRPHFLFTISNVTDDDTREFLEAEGAACLVKPFEVQDFVSRVRRVMLKAAAVHA